MDGTLGLKMTDEERETYFRKILEDNSTLKSQFAEREMLSEWRRLTIEIEKVEKQAAILQAEMEKNRDNGHRLLGARAVLMKLLCEFEEGRRNQANPAVTIVGASEISGDPRLHTVKKGAEK